MFLFFIIVFVFVLINTVLVRLCFFILFFFSSRRRHTRWPRDWSSDVCSSDLGTGDVINIMITASIAVLLLKMIGDNFGSSSIIGLPIVVGVGAGFIGMLTYPFEIGRASCRERV